MSTVWNAQTYDSERRRLVPCFDPFYGTVAEIIARFFPTSPRILDLGAGTGILSSAILERVGQAQISLLDASPEMLQQAEKRLSRCSPKIYVQALVQDLPAGPFDAIVSALAIHHLDDHEKRRLNTKIHFALKPGGIFLNAEQVSGRTRRVQDLLEVTHLDSARSLGSSQVEIQGAVERMKVDKCSPLADQLVWLEQAGFQDVECFFRWFRFAVFGGWKPSESDGISPAS